MTLVAFFVDVRGADDSAARPVRSAKSGRWSAAATWEGGAVPGAGARVLVREGHHVLYDLKSDQPIRGVCVAGTLSFAPDRDTRLDVGLVRIEAIDRYSESGFDCEAHVFPPAEGKPRPALEVGTPERPIDAGRTALIRLTAFDGQDPQSCPAIVCCGGRMDFHGAPLAHTWVKLGAPANVGDATLTAIAPVNDWRPGDRVIVTATTRQNKVKKTFKPSVRDSTQTEERTIVSVEGAKIALDRPLEFDHVAEGDYRGEIANLSRNVVVESADPDKARGQTMYHRHSAGSIGYAEFRHLGKENVLGRYSLHFHLVGDTMRGSSVIGASIHDSGNRWLTIHGTNYLVVRDCVGYRSVGHGFFMEDGTEAFNVLDHNLAVQACIGKPLPKQVLPFDKNDGSGFWWANSQNSFIRNTACECDEYGYFFQATKTAEFDPVLSVQKPDGSSRDVDIRTLPFIRFEANESHCQRRHALNLGGGVPFGEPNVGGVGPDTLHPFILRNTRVWNAHWAIHPVAPSVLLDRLDIRNAEYGIWRPVYKEHVYRDLSMADVPAQTQYAFVNTGRAPEGATLDPSRLADDFPPVSVITHALRGRDGRLIVRGTTTDNGEIKRVLVNRKPAKPVASDYSQWEIMLDRADAADGPLEASAEDAAGNAEVRPHVIATP